MWTDEKAKSSAVVTPSMLHSLSQGSLLEAVEGISSCGVEHSSAANLGDSPLLPLVEPLGRTNGGSEGDAVGSRECCKMMLPAFIPQMPVYAINMMAIPVLPNYVVEHFGLSVAYAGVASSCLSLAPALLDLPGHILADRVGPHALGVFAALCCLGCGLIGLIADVTTCFPLFLLSRSLNGVGQSTWQMSRVLLIARAPSALRAHALAMIGCAARIGSLLSPLVGSHLTSAYGIRGMFAAQSICGLLVVPLALLPVLAPSTWLVPNFVRGSGVGRRQACTSLFGMAKCIANNWRDYATAGFALLLLNVLRQSQYFLLVLKVHAVGGGVAEAGMAVTLTNVFAVMCSPVSGLLMGSLGRKFSLGPALLVCGASCGLLGTPWVRASLPGVMVLACLGGVGNGLSSGTGMCIGSDLAVRREFEGSAVSKAEFLGPWREMMDVGLLLGPSLVGLLITAVSLPTAACACAAAGGFGVAHVIFAVEETLRPR